MCSGIFIHHSSSYILFWSTEGRYHSISPSLMIDVRIVPCVSGCGEGYCTHLLVCSVLGYFWLFFLDGSQLGWVCLCAVSCGPRLRGLRGHRRWEASPEHDWSLGAEEPGLGARKLGPSALHLPPSSVQPASMNQGTTLLQCCWVPSFSPSMTYDSRELSGFFHLLRKS